MRASNQQRSPETAWTMVVGLFEDSIDVRDAIEHLIETDRENVGGHISLLLRDVDAEDGGPAERRTVLAQAVTATGLDRIATLLTNLTVLIIPESGTFLAAGPLGSALLSRSETEQQSAESGKPIGPEALVKVLTRNGFTEDEAHFLERRLLAGGILLGVDCDSEPAIETARQLFAERNAVHIGVAGAERGDGPGERLTEIVPDAVADGEILITDAVSPFTPIVPGSAGAHLRGYFDRPLIDPHGGSVGEIECLLAEDEDEEPRYVIVSFGGLLGLGRRRVAVPVQLLETHGESMQLAVEYEVLDRAPVYDPAAPFSRREEQMVCAYFGMQPYWKEDQPGGEDVRRTG